ncbi:MAG: HGGxSTG domain-containing protein [Micropepsaceae bacterium]
MSGEPHAQVLKALEMAHSAPRCGARCRRNGGAPCRGPAIKGKTRCRMHGGRSSGPSVEGCQKLAAMRWMHGHRSRKMIEARSSAIAVTWGIKRDLDGSK